MWSACTSRKPGRVPLLTAMEEVVLAKRMEAAEFARERLEEADKQAVDSLSWSEGADPARHVDGRRASAGASHPRQRPPGHQRRQEVHRPRRAFPRPDPGRQHRLDPRHEQVRVSARAQVQHLRDLVDPPGGQPRRRRPGAHHPRASAHGRPAQSHAPRSAAAAAGIRARRHAGRSRARNGHHARQGREPVGDFAASGQPRIAHRR